MVSSRDLYYTMAHNEIWTGRDAEKVGNEGKVRVCARRACFQAIDFWLAFHSEKQWGDTAMSYLRNASVDDNLPLEIREAAERLTQKVNLNFKLSHNFDPLEDAEKIVEYFLANKNLYGINNMNNQDELTNKDLELLIHLLKDIEENIIRHELKVNYEEFDITDIEKLRIKLKRMLNKSNK